MLVRVYEIVVCGIVEEDETETDRETGQTGSNPVDAGVRCPGEDEQADRDKPAGHHHRNETGLSWRKSTVFAAEVVVVFVDVRGESCAEQHTDGDGDEHKTGVTGAPALALLINDGVGNEEHVEQSVKDRHVDRHKEDNNLLEEKLEGTEDVNLQTLSKGASIKLLLSDVGIVAGLLAQPLGALEKDGWCVCLRDSKNHGDIDSTSQNELDPVQPAPTQVIGDETTNEGTNGGAEERCSAECRHRYTTLLISPHISERAADNGKRGARL